MMIKRFLRLAVVVGCLCSPALAEVKPAPLFSDHMVLQRNAEVRVWGTAEAGQKVSVSIAEQSVETTADAAGSWQVKLQPMQAGFAVA